MWIEEGRVPSPAEVSKEEGIQLFWAKGICLLLYFGYCCNGGFYFLLENNKQFLIKLYIRQKMLTCQNWMLKCQESIAKAFNDDNSKFKKLGFLFLMPGEIC